MGIQPSDDTSLPIASWLLSVDFCSVLLAAVGFHLPALSDLWFDPLLFGTHPSDETSSLALFVSDFRRLAFFLLAA